MFRSLIFVFFIFSTTALYGAEAHESPPPSYDEVTTPPRRTLTLPAEDQLGETFIRIAGCMVPYEKTGGPLTAVSSNQKTRIFTFESERSFEWLPTEHEERQLVEKHRPIELLPHTIEHVSTNGTGSNLHIVAYKGREDGPSSHALCLWGDSNPSGILLEPWQDSEPGTACCAEWCDDAHIVATIKNGFSLWHVQPEGRRRVKVYTLKEPALPTTLTTCQIRGTVALGTADGRVALFRKKESAKPVVEFNASTDICGKQANPLRALSLSGGNTLATSSGNTVKLWDLRNTREPICTMEEVEPVSTLQFNPTGKFLAYAVGAAVKIYEGDQWTDHIGHNFPVQDIKWGERKRELATVAHNGINSANSELTLFSHRDERPTD